MTGPWRIHLAPEAEAALREVSRSAGAVVARTLDDLAQRGRSAVVLDRDDGTAWTGHVAAGDHLVTVAGREGDDRIVVVRLTLLESARGVQQAVDLLPLRASTRRSLGSVLQGIELDLRYTLRTLRRAPLFAAVVIGTLAAGFGGATALLDVVHTVYGRALPFADGDRLVRIRNANVSPNGEVRRYNLAPSDYDLFHRSGRAFDGVVAQAARSLSLVGDGPAERVAAAGVSAHWAATLGVRPVLGRAFLPDEEAAGSAAGVALIAHDLWQRRFGGDTAVVGRTLAHDAGVLTVIGVMPPAFRYPYDASVWTPWTFDLASASSALNVVARLAEGASLEAARADANRLHGEREAANLQRSATGFDVATVRSDFIRDEARTVQALSAAVFFLLLLACVNVANLLVARFATRRVELGLRAALGGRRNQQIRQMLVESLVLFVAGTLGGLWLGQWLRSALTVTIPDNFRTELGVAGTSVGTGIAVLTMVLGVVIGVMVGLVAARRAVRTDPMILVRQGGRGSIGRSDRRVFDVLVATQLSLSLVLLVGASLLIGRFRSLSTADSGYELTGVATMRMTIEQERFRQPDVRRQLVAAIEERLAVVPGVEAVGITTVNPLCCGDWGAPIEVEGRPVAPNDAPTLVAHSYVTPGYFAAMRIPMRRGTGFDPGAPPDGPMTVVIDEEFARLAWPGEDALGRRVRIARPDQPWRTVIGIVPVTEHEAEMRAAWFLPYAQDPLGASTDQLHVMVRRTPAVSMEALRREVAEIDPTLAVYGVTTMASLQRDRTLQDRLGAIVAGVFASFGLVLAGFSLYGLLSYSVELRRGEMGIRMALGASRRSIVRLVVGQATRRLAAGTVLGVALALTTNQILRSAIEGLPWVSWQMLVGLTGVMAAVTLVAAAVPAVRATRVSPIRALRG